MLEVPARLLAGMREGAYDLALLPVIDYQRMGGLCLVPVGGIGCDGPTLTVRVFSRVAVGEIRTLACDRESHTSVALARVVLGERYGIRPTFLDLGGEQETEARLLIGDKVVCEEPKGFEYQLDLGAAWKELTGMPFVFAAWMAKEGVELGELPGLLEDAKRQGKRNIDEIVREYAVPRGWPAEVANQYLTRHLKFDVGAREMEAMELFWGMARRWGVLEGEVRAMRVHPSMS